MIYQLLRGDLGISATSLLNVLQGKIQNRNRWRANAHGANEGDYDKDLKSAYLSALKTDQALFQRLVEVCDRFRRYRIHIPHEDSRLRYRVIRDLRLTLARACVHALQPDLVILDEFQRFKDLWTGKTKRLIWRKRCFAFLAFACSCCPLLRTKCSR